MLTNKELLPETRNLTPDTMIYSHALKNLRALATSRGQTEHWILNTVFLFFFALAALAPRAEATWATGGTVTNYTANGTNWIAHLFTSVGTTSLNVSAGGNVEVLVVGGGGAGGQGDNGDGAGGGGGAGGLIYTNVTLVAGSNYTVVVGSGGDTNTFANGSNSVFGSLTALGGGYGGRMWIFGATNGGCGGGGSGRPGVTSAGSATQPGSSSRGYGNNGGAGVSSGNGGGGGGAGSAGVAGGSGSTGGNGFTNSISGVERVYAGGGGGGSGVSGQAAGTATGGGGAGGAWGQNNGANAVANTGGGGGGGGESPSAGQITYGGRGGSGIVIVRYVLPPPPKGTVVMLR